MPRWTNVFHPGYPRDPRSKQALPGFATLGFGWGFLISQDARLERSTSSSDSPAGRPPRPPLTHTLSARRAGSVIAVTSVLGRLPADSHRVSKRVLYSCVSEALTKFVANIMLKMEMSSKLDKNSNLKKITKRKKAYGKCQIRGS